MAFMCTSPDADYSERLAGLDEEVLPGGVRRSTLLYGETVACYSMALLEALREPGLRPSQPLKLNPGAED